MRKLFSYGKLYKYKFSAAHCVNSVYALQKFPPVAKHMTFSMQHEFP